MGIIRVSVTRRSGVWRMKRRAQPPETRQDLPTSHRECDVFERVFGPRIDDPDPQVRVRALHACALDDPRRAELAHADPHPDVRRAALAELLDLDVLRAALREDADGKSRAVAAERYQELMAGVSGTAPDLSQRLEHLRAGVTERLATFLVMHADDPQLRSIASSQLDDEELLARIAVEDVAAEVRLTAVERIATESLLETVARDTRDRDKRVSRSARDKLDAARQGREHAEAGERLCADMESLVGAGLSAQESGIQRLERAWEPWSQVPGDDVLRARYEDARSKVREQIAERLRVRKTRAGLIARAESLEQELRPLSEPDAALETRISGALDAIGAEWGELPTASDDAVARLATATERVTRQRERLRANHIQCEPFRAILSEMTSALDAGAAWPAARARRVEQRWSDLRQPTDTQLSTELRQQYASLSARLADREARTREAQEAELKKLAQAVDDVERQIATGELKKAAAAFDKVRAALDSLDAPAGNKRRLQDRLRDLTPGLGELRSWRHWGTDRARERLCEEVEALIGVSVPPVDLAKQIRAYRENWKKLDRGEGGASRKLWKRFDTACTTAYEPCKEHFSKQASHRQDNRAAKQAILQRLDQYERETDWNEANWRAADDLWHQAERDWHKTGPVDRKASKALDTARRELRERWEEHLGPQRHAEQKRREDLIASLRSLAESGDTRRGVDRIREARAGWAPKVRAERKVERALWRDFQTACDAVFERVKSERNQASAERAAALALRAGICDRVESDAAALEQGADASVDIAASKASLRKARSEFAAAGDVPARERPRITGRFEKACARVDTALTRLRVERKRAGIRALAARAAICADLEQRVLGDDSPDGRMAARADAESDWAALAEAGEPTREIAERFEVACAAAEQDASREALARVAAANKEAKESICLQLEVLTGIDSPPEYEKARMALQVSRLQQSLAGKGTEAGDPASLERDWYRTGAVPPADHAALEARFARVVAVLHPDA